MHVHALRPVGRPRIARTWGVLPGHLFLLSRQPRQPRQGLWRSWPPFPIGGGEEEEEEEEEERDLINDLKRHGRLAVAWDRHGSPVPRWTLTRLDNTPTLLALSLEEEEEEEEERLYLQLETRERVQTNEAKSKRRRASPT